jgi:hypothetical protein
MRATTAAAAGGTSTSVIHMCGSYGFGSPLLFPDGKNLADDFRACLQPTDGFSGPGTLYVSVMGFQCQDGEPGVPPLNERTAANSCTVPFNIQVVHDSCATTQVAPTPMPTASPTPSVNGSTTAAPNATAPPATAAPGAGFDSCSGHGTCGISNYGLCSCQAGWSGGDCGTPDCGPYFDDNAENKVYGPDELLPVDCYGNGVCGTDRASGAATCMCDESHFVANPTTAAEKYCMTLTQTTNVASFKGEASAAGLPASGGAANTGSFYWTGCAAADPAAPADAAQFARFNSSAEVEAAECRSFHETRTELGVGSWSVYRFTVPDSVTGGAGGAGRAAAYARLSHMTTSTAVGSTARFGMSDPMLFLRKNKLPTLRALSSEEMASQHSDMDSWTEDSAWETSAASGGSVAESKSARRLLLDGGEALSPGVYYLGVHNSRYGRATMDFDLTVTLVRTAGAASPGCPATTAASWVPPPFSRRGRALAATEYGSFGSFGRSGSFGSFGSYSTAAPTPVPVPVPQCGTQACTDPYAGGGAAANVGGGAAANAHWEPREVSAWYGAFNCSGHGSCSTSGGPLCVCESEPAAGGGSSSVYYSGQVCQRAVTVVPLGAAGASSSTVTGLALEPSGWSYFDVTLPASTMAESYTRLTVVLEVAATPANARQPLPLLLLRGPAYQGEPRLDDYALSDFHDANNGGAAFSGTTKLVQAVVVGDTAGAEPLRACEQNCYKIAVYNRATASGPLRDWTLTVSLAAPTPSTCAAGGGDAGLCSSHGTCSDVAATAGVGHRCECDSGWDGATCSSPLPFVQHQLQAAAAELLDLCSDCEMLVKLTPGQLALFRVPGPLHNDKGVAFSVKPWAGTGGSADMYLSTELPRSVYDFESMVTGPFGSSGQKKLRVQTSSPSGRFWLGVLARTTGVDYADASTVEAGRVVQRLSRRRLAQLASAGGLRRSLGADAACGTANLPACTTPLVGAWCVTVPETGAAGTDSYKRFVDPVSKLSVFRQQVFTAEGSAGTGVKRVVAATTSLPLGAETTAAQRLPASEAAQLLLLASVEVTNVAVTGVSSTAVSADGTAALEVSVTVLATPARNSSTPTVATVAVAVTAFGLLGFEGVSGADHETFQLSFSADASGLRPAGFGAAAKPAAAPAAAQYYTVTGSRGFVDPSTSNDGGASGTHCTNATTVNQFIVKVGFVG